ncbi:hypothetical protein LZ575_07310 [Antarcticibacterium sp. 1MA-6-2]|uniref:hypothetical protein n=1 Tax=Antarcticibacterium sp. 1MA-6-2 TaxID=2908210 RepID=UPI001F41A791|nr:hypothetical protein [Antarcticibacterium sp. 1MA-6-2]UJH92329.1 hypothetical protein LZ575_07310 [Antarcticibacterium sp. 1MA-6-2]
MVTTKDIYDLKLLKEGMRVTEFLRNSSSSIFLDELKKLNLIFIDAQQRVFLTGKGQVARKIGLEKFVELEEFEKELTTDNIRETYLRNNLYIILLCALNLILIAILIYINTQVGQMP